MDSEIFGYLDLPKNGDIIRDLVLEIHGWAFSVKNPEVAIEIFLDKNLIEKIPTSIARKDVSNTYSSYGNAKNSGFFYSKSLENIQEGLHNLQIYADDENSKKNIGTVNFEIQKNQSSIQDDSNLPPEKLNQYIGGGNFSKTGREFFGYFINIANLKLDENILDVGCGAGRMAIPLSNYLKQGKYEGIDIYEEGIAWCKKNIEPKFPNFHFQTIDVYHEEYNKRGKQKGSEYKFPFNDGSFDFVFLTSVFTHMLPNDMENYLTEISRVLKKGGRCFITYFLLNSESLKIIEGKNSPMDLKYQFEGFRSTSKTNPERVIALYEEEMKDIYEKLGLDIVKPILYGKWTGKEEGLSYQDIILAIKK